MLCKRPVPRLASLHIKVKPEFNQQTIRGKNIDQQEAAKQREGRGK